MTNRDAAKVLRLLRLARSYCDYRGSVKIKAEYDLQAGGYRLHLWNKNKSWSHAFGANFPSTQAVKISVRAACIQFLVENKKGKRKK